MNEKTHKNNPIKAVNTALKDKKTLHVFTLNEDGYRVKEPYTEENVFLTAEAKSGKLPTYDEARPHLPRPIWEGREDVLSCYDRVWELAFEHLRPANGDARIISPLIDCAFYDFTFMWDSCFITMFAKYAMHFFDFQSMLDNFYAHQHADGFICRQLFQAVEGARFSRDDPSSTGPNIFPWVEWEYYQTTKDIERLKKVFPPLCAYHRWLQRNRTWQSGAYWSTGLGCGMDNQPRLPSGVDVMCAHGFMTWLDICAQQYLSADILIKMSKELGREQETDWLKEERALLGELVNNQLWDEKTAFYYDADRTGNLLGVKSVGAYWTLVAGLVPEHRAERFIAHLDNEKEFKRPTRIPTLSADHPEYERLGGYWRGGVWAPTNYMVLKGLEKYGYNDLAYEIACNYLETVVEVFKNTGTVYENYSPEEKRQGFPALDEFVGWTGLAPISVLLEYVFGIRPQAQERKIIWRINRLEKHGVQRYPLGDATVELVCESRSTLEEKPCVTIKSDRPITVELVWQGGAETITVKPEI